MCGRLQGESLGYSGQGVGTSDAGSQGGPRTVEQSVYLRHHSKALPDRFVNVLSGTRSRQDDKDTKRTWNTVPRKILGRLHGRAVLEGSIALKA